MSGAQVHKWLGLPLSQRRRFIRDFYKHNQPERAEAFLSLVKAPRGYGVYASIGPNYQFAVFGRDSIELAEDLLETNQALAKEIILLLAHLQGYEFNLASEQEASKIHHEYRTLRFNDREVPIAARKVLAKMGPQWGGSEEEMLYYGSADATPLFVRLVHRYYLMYEDDILNHTVTSRSGHKRALKHHVRDATEWLVAKITASPWQLLEYKRINPLGLYNQSWQDSSVSYLHADGGAANADGGLAAIEIQGYAYDALRAAADMVAFNEAEADAWRHLASIVRDNTIDHMWMPQTNYFAMGVDRTGTGATRQISTYNSNPALLIESNFFELMPHNLSWQYIEHTVRTLFSDDFLTLAGLRIRAKRHAGLVDFADYHGSLVSWPKQTYDVAKGLRKLGFYRLAALLEDCILHAVGQAGEFYEFFFVDTKGDVKYHYRQENPDEPSFHEFGAANLPEPGQSWTISAVLAIVASRHKQTAHIPQLEEMGKLEDYILSLPHVVAIAKQLDI